MCGCTASHYRRSADKEVYKIIHQAENQVFGHTNAFTISTPYSNRKPADILPPELIEDRTQTNRRVIGLDQTLDLAVVRSREYQAQKEQLYLTALTLTGSRYQFTPIFFANSTAQVEGTGDERMSGLMRNRVGVSQLMKTGGSLSVSLANDLLRYFIGKPAGLNRSTAIDTISVELSQPILRGFGRNDPQVEALTQSERNVIYAIRSFSLYQNQFAIDVVNDYFSLLAQKDIVRNNYTNYLRRVETTEYLQARQDRVRDADVADARSAELGARISYVNSVAFYQNQLASFKLRLGIPITEDLFIQDADLKELEKAGLLPVRMDTSAAFHIAVEKHMDILNAIDRFEDSKRKIRVSADQLKPGLGFFARTAAISDAPYDYARFDLDQVGYTAGLTLDLPLDRLRERNTYRQSLVSFESQLRSLIATLDGFKDRIDRGFRTLEQQRQNYLNRQASLGVAERRLDMNRELLAAGRAEIRDVRESQDALISAQNQLTEATVAYLDARLQLLLDIGVLSTSTDRFWLKDPLSPAETPTQVTPAAAEASNEPLTAPNQVLEPLP